MSEKTPIERLIKYFGTQNITTRKLGLKNRQAVHIWVRQGYIPRKRGTLVMRKTKGEITAQEVWLAAAIAREAIEKSRSVQTL